MAYARDVPAADLFTAIPVTIAHDAQLLNSPFKSYSAILPMEATLYTLLACPVTNRWRRLFLLCVWGRCSTILQLTSFSISL